MKRFKSIKDLQEERERMRPVKCWLCEELIVAPKVLQYEYVGEIEAQPLCYPVCVNAVRNAGK